MKRKQSGDASQSASRSSVTGRRPRLRVQPFRVTVSRREQLCKEVLDKCSCKDSLYAVADSSSLTSLSAQLAKQTSLLAEEVGSPQASPSYLDLVRSAQSATQLAERVLKLCVQQSRDAGHTWQEVGDLLGVTRQAAFQRFGKPIDPRTGEPMERTVHITDAAERAVRIITDFLEGRMDDARKSFNPQVLAALTDEKRGSALATVAGLVGAFEGFGEGEPLVRRIGDHTVVDIPVRYEAGDMKARVAFDEDAKVAGLFILPPETP